MTDVVTRSSSTLRVVLDERPEHVEWDRFLGDAPDGHHVQTSMWARLKDFMGWSAVRVVAEHDGQIVAGAQVLSRPVSRLGRVGYIAHAPVARDTEGAAAEAVLDSVEQLARERRIRHLTIRGPLPAPGQARVRDRAHYLPGNESVAPAATSLIDLDVDLDTLLGRMERRTRYNVRLSGRSGVTVHDGGEADLALYHSMVEATAQRRGFSAFPLAYYQELWQILHPGEHVRLAVAELGGEPVAAQLAIAFGTTVVNKLSVWSGQGGKAKPNEAIQWSTMQWAKDRGYRIYDLEGIDIEAARLDLGGESLPERFRQTTTSFKLGFGGRTVLAPPTHAFVYNRLPRRAFAEVERHPRCQQVLKRVRKRIRTASP